MFMRENFVGTPLTAQDKQNLLFLASQIDSTTNEAIKSRIAKEELIIADMDYLSSLGCYDFDNCIRVCNAWIQDAIITNGIIHHKEYYILKRKFEFLDKKVEQNIIETEINNIVNLKGITWGELTKDEKEDMLCHMDEINMIDDEKGSCTIYFKNVDLSIYGLIVFCKEEFNIEIDDDEIFYDPRELL